MALASDISGRVHAKLQQVWSHQQPGESSRTLWWLLAEVSWPFAKILPSFPLLASIRMLKETWQKPLSSQESDLTIDEDV